MRVRSSRPAKAAGAYVVTQWNKPADLHPWDFDPNYVAHISFSGVPYGKAMAEALIKAMGGKGGIVALGGIESNMPAIERKKGLDAALAANPDVKLLDFQVANWSANEALTKVNAWLTQFGDKIGGIWAANDDMALAAVEALRADGRAGKVPVTGIDGIQLAVEAIQKGEMAGTVAWDPTGRAAWAFAIGYAAKTGKFDPSKEPKEHREFYGTGVIITSDNANDFYDENIKTEPTLDWNDIWGRVSGQIQYCRRPPRGKARLATLRRARMTLRRTTMSVEPTRSPTPRAAAARAEPAALGWQLGAARRARPALRHHHAHQSELPLTGNFVRIAQTAMIPLVLGLGATFVILMGSIDLSVEGVLALGARAHLHARRQRRQRQ